MFFLLVLILLLMPTRNFFPVWFALSLLRFRLPARLHIMFFFFFQAEDGIRDVAVTGVQTCCSSDLPRHVRAEPDPHVGSRSRDDAIPRRERRRRRALRIPARRVPVDDDRRHPATRVSRPARGGRSEERRVGKECRARWSPDREKKKQ